MSTNTTVGEAGHVTSGVLFTLATGQFLMALDSSVMNVSIATVAKDVGSTVTGIQLAITLYTLVMAMVMVTGGKIGSLIGRLRTFEIGCVIYGLGSLTTALAPNLPVLVLGWSVLEGIGAALILPAIVALVAGSYPPVARPRAYGLIMGAGAVAIAVGPLIGGLATTYASWRWVFAGEVVLVAGILLLARRIADAQAEPRVRFDVIGALLAAAGLGPMVFGVLRSADWGWVAPKPGAPSLLDLSLTVWFVLACLVFLWLFVEREQRLETQGGEPLVKPSLFGNRQLTGGLLMFFFLYLVQAGLFFTIPLYLSVSLGLSALDTGIRILPLSVTLLLAAIGTALAGAVLITALSTSFLDNIDRNPAIPEQVKVQADTRLAGGVPFLSDADLRDALAEAGIAPDVAAGIADVNSQARIDGLRGALTVLALIAPIGVFFARRIPARPQQKSPATKDSEDA
jgi:MFS family permease